MDVKFGAPQKSLHPPGVPALIPSRSVFSGFVKMFRPACKRLLLSPVTVEAINFFATTQILADLSTPHRERPVTTQHPLRNCVGH